MFSVSEHLFGATIFIPFPERGDHWQALGSIRGLQGTASPSLRKDQKWCHRLRRAYTCETRWLGYVTFQCRPDRRTQRYIYTFASPLKVYLWSSSNLYSNFKQFTWGIFGINRMTTKLTPCVSSYYMKTNILHLKSCVFVYSHHLEIIRTRYTNIYSNNNQWHIEGTTLSEWTTSAWLQ